MSDLNFCPFCDSPGHKVLDLQTQYFCRSCNKFFTLAIVQYKCPKCGSLKCQDSDFPAPDGQIVIQCQKCKKMFSLKEFLEKQ